MAGAGAVPLLFSPSREDVPEYQDYGDECLAEAKRINAEFGTRRWQPIDVRVQEDYAFAVAAYDMYDVLLVNPTYDGRTWWRWRDRSSTAVTACSCSRATRERSAVWGARRSG